MTSLRTMLRKFGPGMLVTAAFIGPGTVTTASKAGAAYGFTLLWAILFAIVATIVLQEMSARLGLMSRRGLGEAIRASLKPAWMQALAGGLIVLAIGFGNAAYQTGNVIGAAVGLESLSGISLRVWSIAVGLVAGALLMTGAHRVITRGLIAMVLVMSLSFVITAVLVRPSPSAIAVGLVVPQLPPGGLTTVLALIGTTAVPYNLFLHASSVQLHWPEDVSRDQALTEARLDTVLAVGVGGVVTAAILTTAAQAFYPGEITNAAEMAKQLEPTLGGVFSRVLFSVGLMAAGLTSAITAPLAAAYAVSGALGWPLDLKSARFRSIWMLVLLCGTILAATLRSSPAETILVAQVANGLLLPLVAGFLIFAVNQRSLMGGHVNGAFANLMAVLVLVVVIVMTAVKLADLLG